jgi:hypothetical protein
MELCFHIDLNFSSVIRVHLANWNRFLGWITWIGSKGKKSKRFIGETCQSVRMKQPNRCSNRFNLLPIQTLHRLWSYLQEIAPTSSSIWHFTPEHASRHVSTRSTTAAAQSMHHVTGAQIHRPMSKITRSDVTRSLPTQGHLPNVSRPPHRRCQAVDPEKSTAPPRT